MQPLSLLGGDVIAVIGHRLDAILDVAQRARLVLIASSDKSCSTSVAIASRRLSRSSTSCRPARGEEQPVGAPVLRIVPPLEQAVFDQTIEQPHQRDRLQLEHVGEIDLRQAFLLRAGETARSTARGWCRGSWRGDRCNCAAAANSRRVVRSTGVSDRATCAWAVPKAFQLFRILKL